MGEHSFPSASVAVSRAGVTVERTLRRDERAIVGTLDIRSARDEPVLVHVVDRFPSALGVHDAAFEPDAEPDMGDVSSHGASVRHVVGDESAQVRYRLVPSDEPSDVEWEAPTIRSVERTDFMRDAAEVDRGTEGSTADPASSDLFQQLEAVFDRTASGSETAPDDPADAPEDAPAGDDESTGAGSGDADEATPSESAGASAAGPASERSTERDAEPPADVEGDERATPGDAQPLTRGASRSSPTVPADADRERAVPRSLEVRLDRLSARVEEMASYATALEAIIDEYGTGTEVVEGIERRLDDLDGRLASLRADFDDAHDTYAEDLDSVQADVSSLDDDLERLDETVDDLGTAVETNEAGVDAAERDLSTLETRVDGFESDLESLRETVRTVETELSTVRGEVGEVRSELDVLRDQVDSLNAFRKSLAEISDLEKD